MNSSLPLRQSGRLQKRTFLWFGVGLAALVLLTIVGLVIHRTIADSAVREKLAELEAAGVPITLEEVNRRYHEHGYDQTENAAPVYDEAFAATVSEDLPIEELAEAVRVNADEAPRISERVVSANGDAIALYKKAADLPYLRFNLDFTKGSDLLIPHVSDLRQGGHILAGEAVVAAVDDDAIRAVEAIEAIFQIAGHISEEPTLISHLTQIVLETAGGFTLQRVLEKVELPVSALESFGVKLERLEKGPRLEPPLGVEIAHGGWIYDRVAGGGEPWIKFYHLTGMLARDQDFYLTQMEEYLRVARLPFSERVEVEWEEEHEWSVPIRARWVAGIALPAVERVMEADNGAVTALRAARIALAAEQYRLKKGSFPSDLEDLVPDYFEELPGDPYSEDGFRFVSEADAVFVRSKKTIDLSGGNVPIQFRLPVR